MNRNTWYQTVQALTGLHSYLEKAHYTDAARIKADELRTYMPRAAATGLLGDSRLANMSDLLSEGMFNPNGLFIGAYQGKMLFFDGEGPILTYLRTGGGKGVNYLLPNNAHSRDRSLVEIDVKDGELAYASWDHRETTLGTKCIALDPFGISGRPNTRINPLQRLIDIVRRGEEIDTEADEIAQILLPANPSDGDAWVRKGAIRLLSLRMEYLAWFEPDACSLSGLWRFVNAGREQMDVAFAMMKTCGHAGIAGRAEAIHTTMEDAPKQWEAIKGDCIEAVASFEPGKTFAKATDVNDFNFGALKHQKHTVYIIVPSEKIGVAAPWISLIINHAIEQIALERGTLRTTFLLDEMPQLPPAPAILKALRLYRGKNIQLWMFAQGRYSLRDKWPEAAVNEFEDQAALMTFGSVQDPNLVRDIGVWSGTSSVVLNNQSYSGGMIEAANAGLSENKRDLLQPENIFRATITRRQIIKIRTLPYLLVADTVPYYLVHPWKHQIRDVRDLHNGVMP